MAEEQKNGWNEWSKHIIHELERLNTNTERLREDLQNSNTEITKLQALRKDLSELKHRAAMLRQEIDKSSFRFEARVDEKIKELISSLSEGVKELREENYDLTRRITELEGQKKYVRGMMVAIAFIITTIIAVLALFDWGNIGG